MPVFSRRGQKRKQSVRPPREEWEEEGGRGGERGFCRQRRAHANGLCSPRVACRNLHTFCFLSFFVCLFGFFFLNLSGMQEVKNAFNEYTIYYHATTTRGHPGTCAPLKYTEETSKIQQLQAGIHG